MIKQKAFRMVFALSVMIMVSASSAVWAADCENATFDLTTGVLHIPVVSIDDELFSADLKKQGNSANYKLLGFVPMQDDQGDTTEGDAADGEEEADDGECEIATYDEASGIIHVPSLELGVLVYSADLVRKGKSDTFTLDENSMVLVDTTVRGEGCEPAAYDVMTGVLTIPAVEVEDALFSAIMARRGNSSNFELVFVENASEVNGDEGGEDTEDEADEEEAESAEDQEECETATFTAVTGILHLPLIKVGNDYYTADLQLRGKSQNIYFDIAALEEISSPGGAEGNDEEGDNEGGDENTEDGNEGSES